MTTRPFSLNALRTKAVDATIRRVQYLHKDTKLEAKRRIKAWCQLASIDAIERWRFEGIPEKHVPTLAKKTGWASYQIRPTERELNGSGRQPA